MYDIHRVYQENFNSADQIYKKKTNCGIIYTKNSFLDQKENKL